MRRRLVTRHDHEIRTPGAAYGAAPRPTARATSIKRKLICIFLNRSYILIVAGASNDKIGSGSPPHPLRQLDEDDLNFVLRLVLASGSLKDLAASYGVSYPTIRVRLDRVIQRLRALVENRPVDPLTDLLAGLIERGELSARAARQIQKTWAELRGREQ